MNNKPRPRSILSLFVVLVFTVTTIGADALPALARQSPFSEVHPGIFLKTPLTLPAELGTVEEFHWGEGPTLIHIQTAHGDYSAQKKIQAILHHLEENYGFKHLLVEGSAFKLKPELLRVFPDRPDLTMKVAEALTKQAIVKGEELFLLEAPEAEAQGIEEIDSYRANGEALRKVLTERGEIEKFLEASEIEMDRDASRILNPKLRIFLKRFAQFEEGKFAFTSWFRYLASEAKRVLKVDLTDPMEQLDWPMLVRIFKLQEFEAKLDPVAFENERGEFLSQVAAAFGRRHSESSASTASMTRAKNLRDPSVPSGLQDDAYAQISNLLTAPPSRHSLPHPDTTRLFEAMVRRLPRNFDYAAYPNVCRFIGHLILQSELRADRLDEEMKRLADRLTLGLAGKNSERHLLRRIKNFRLLKKLLRLELTEKEYSFLSRHYKLAGSGRNNPASVILRPTSWAEESQRSFAPSGLRMTEKSLPFRKALAFYRLAKLRDTHLLRNVEARFREKGIAKAIVITGGFHSGPFRKYFQGKNYTYALITPRIAAEDDSELREGRQAYLDLMLKSLPYPVTRSAYASPYFLTSTRSEIRLLGFEPVPALKAVRRATDEVIRESRTTSVRAEVRQKVQRAEVRKKGERGKEWRNKGVSVDVSGSSARERSTRPSGESRMLPKALEISSYGPSPFIGISANTIPRMKNAGVAMAKAWKSVRQVLLRASYLFSVQKRRFIIGGNIPISSIIVNHKFYPSTGSISLPPPRSEARLPAGEAGLPARQVRKEEVEGKTSGVSSDALTAMERMPAVIGGVDYSKELERILRYRVYEASRLARLAANLDRVFKEGRNVFKGFKAEEKLGIYNLSVLLGLDGRLKASGIDPDEFSFDSGAPEGFRDGLSPKLSRGYAVHGVYSKITTDNFRWLSEAKEHGFPLENIAVLDLGGASGKALLRLAPLLRNSRLAVVDANAENVSEAMRQFDAVQDTNQYEAKLADARSGFEGIPYPDGAFDLIVMLGYTEFQLKEGDLKQLLEEVFRVLKPNGGRFLVEATNTMHRHRYIGVFRDFAKSLPAGFRFKLFPLADSDQGSVFVVTTERVSLEGAEVEELPAGRDPITVFGDLSSFANGGFAGLKHESVNRVTWRHDGVFVKKEFTADLDEGRNLVSFGEVTVLFGIFRRRIKLSFSPNRVLIEIKGYWDKKARSRLFLSGNPLVDFQRDYKGRPAVFVRPEFSKFWREKVENFIGRLVERETLLRLGPITFRQPLVLPNPENFHSQPSPRAEVRSQPVLADGRISGSRQPISMPPVSIQDLEGLKFFRQTNLSILYEGTTKDGKRYIVKIALPEKQELLWREIAILREVEAAPALQQRIPRFVGEGRIGLWDLTRLFMERFWRMRKTKTIFRGRNLLARWQSPYLIEERIEGVRFDARFHRLKKENRERDHLEAQVLDDFISIAEAVLELHHNRVIHRDLGPMEIHFNPEGEIQFTDFGLAVTPGHPEISTEQRYVAKVLDDRLKRKVWRLQGPSRDIAALIIMSHNYLAGLLPESLVGTEIEKWYTMLEKEINSNSSDFLSSSFSVDAVLKFLRGLHEKLKEQRAERTLSPEARKPELQKPPRAEVRSGSADVGQGAPWNNYDGVKGAFQEFIAQVALLKTLVSQKGLEILHQRKYWTGNRFLPGSHHRAEVRGNERGVIISFPKDDDPELEQAVRSIFRGHEEILWQLGIRKIKILRAQPSSSGGVKRRSGELQLALSKRSPENVVKQVLQLLRSQNIDLSGPYQVKQDAPLSASQQPRDDLAREKVASVNVKLPLLPPGPRRLILSSQKLGEWRQQSYPSQPVEEGLLHKEIPGERPTQATYDERLLSLLTPETVRRIERVKTEYPDRWEAGNIEGKIPDSAKQRMTTVPLPQPIEINGEAVDAVEITGVAFRREDIGKPYLGRWLSALGKKVGSISEEDLKRQGHEVVSVEFDLEGRPIFGRPQLMQRGAHGFETARMKFNRSRTVLRQLGLRGPIALGYDLYTDPELKWEGRDLGIFTSLRRKNAPSRYRHAMGSVFSNFALRFGEINRRMRKKFVQIARDAGRSITYNADQILKRVAKDYDLASFYWGYGLLLYEITRDFFPKDPQMGNVAVDLEGNEPPIWYDMGSWRERRLLSPAQSLAYRYYVLSYGVIAVSADMVRSGMGHFLEAGIFDPHHAFLSGFFSEWTGHELFNLRDFKRLEEGFTNVDQSLLDQNDPRPIHTRDRAPFIQLLREIENDPHARKGFLRAEVRSLVTELLKFALTDYYGYTGKWAYFGAVGALLFLGFLAYELGAEGRREKEKGTGTFRGTGKSGSPRAEVRNGGARRILKKGEEIFHRDLSRAQGTFQGPTIDLPVVRNDQSNSRLGMFQFDMAAFLSHIGIASAFEGGYNFTAGKKGWFGQTKWRALRLRDLWRALILWGRAPDRARWLLGYFLTPLHGFSPEKHTRAGRAPWRPYIRPHLFRVRPSTSSFVTSAVKGSRSKIQSQAGYQNPLPAAATSSASGPTLRAYRPVGPEAGRKARGEVRGVLKPVEEVETWKASFRAGEFKAVAKKLIDFYWLEVFQDPAAHQRFLRDLILGPRFLSESGGRLFPEYFNPSFVRDYRRQLDEARTPGKGHLYNWLSKFVWDYLSVAQAVAEGKRGDVFPREVVRYQQYFKALYGNFQGEPFTNYEIVPQRILVGQQGASETNDDDMVLLRAFRHYGLSERRWRTFLAATYRRKMLVLYRSLSHKHWRRIEVSFPNNPVPKPTVEAVMDLNPVVSEQLDSFLKRGKFQDERGHQIQIQTVGLRPRRSSQDSGQRQKLSRRRHVALLTRRLQKEGIVLRPTEFKEGFERYFETEPRSANEADVWFQENLEKLRQTRFFARAEVRGVLGLKEIKEYRRIASELAQVISKDPRLKGGGALVIDGPSGAGKTTLVKDFLLPNLLVEGERVGLEVLNLDFFQKNPKEKKQIEEAIVSRGKSVTDEFERMWRIGMIDTHLNEILDFVTSQGPAGEPREFFIDPAFIREAPKGRKMQPKRLRFLHGQIVLIDGKYPLASEVLRSGRYPLLKFRIKANPKRVGEQVLSRMAAAGRRPASIDQRVTVLQLLFWPSWKKYERETESEIDGVIDLSSNNPRQWSVKLRSAEVELKPQPNRRSEVRRKKLTEERRRKLERDWGWAVTILTNRLGEAAVTGRIKGLVRDVTHKLVKKYGFRSVSPKKPIARPGPTKGAAGFIGLLVKTPLRAEVRGGPSEQLTAIGDGLGEVKELLERYGFTLRRKDLRQAQLKLRELSSELLELAQALSEGSIRPVDPSAFRERLTAYTKDVERKNRRAESLLNQRFIWVTATTIFGFLLGSFLGPRFVPGGQFSILAGAALGILTLHLLRLTGFALYSHFRPRLYQKGEELEKIRALKERIAKELAQNRQAMVLIDGFEMSGKRTFGKMLATGSYGIGRDKIDLISYDEVTLDEALARAPQPGKELVIIEGVSVLELDRPNLLPVTPIRVFIVADEGTRRRNAFWRSPIGYLAWLLFTGSLPYGVGTSVIDAEFPYDFVLHFSKSRRPSQRAIRKVLQSDSGPALRAEVRGEGNLELKIKNEKLEDGNQISVSGVTGAMPSGAPVIGNEESGSDKKGNSDSSHPQWSHLAPFPLREIRKNRENVYADSYPGALGQWQFRWPSVPASNQAWSQFPPLFMFSPTSRATAPIENATILTGQENPVKKLLAYVAPSVIEKIFSIARSIKSRFSRVKNPILSTISNFSLGKIITIVNIYFGFTHTSFPAAFSTRVVFGATNAKSLRAEVRGKDGEKQDLVNLDLLSALRKRPFFRRSRWIRSVRPFSAQEIDHIFTVGELGASGEHILIDNDTDVIGMLESQLTQLQEEKRIGNLKLGVRVPGIAGVQRVRAMSFTYANSSGKRTHHRIILFTDDIPYLTAILERRRRLLKNRDWFRYLWNKPVDLFVAHDWPYFATVLTLYYLRKGLHKESVAAIEKDLYREPFDFLADVRNGREVGRRKKAALYGRVHLIEGNLLKQDFNKHIEKLISWSRKTRFTRRDHQRFVGEIFWHNLYFNEDIDGFYDDPERYDLLRSLHRIIRRLLRNPGHPLTNFFCDLRKILSRHPNSLFPMAPSASLRAEVRMRESEVSHSVEEAMRLGAERFYWEDKRPGVTALIWPEDADIRKEILDWAKKVPDGLPAVGLGAGELNYLDQELIASNRISRFDLVDLFPYAPEKTLQHRKQDYLVREGKVRVLEADLSMVRPEFYAKLNQVIDQSPTLAGAVEKIASLFSTASEERQIFRHDLPEVLSEGEGTYGLVVSGMLLHHMAAAFRNALLLRLKHRFQVSEEVVRGMVKKSLQFNHALHSIASQMMEAHARLVKKLLHPEGIAHVSSFIVRWEDKNQLPWVERERQVKRLTPKWLAFEFGSVARIYQKAGSPQEGKKEAEERGGLLAELSTIDHDSPGASGIQWSTPWTLLNTSDAPWVKGTKVLHTRVWPAQGESGLAQSLVFRLTPRAEVRGDVNEKRRVLIVDDNPKSLAKATLKSPPPKKEASFDFLEVIKGEFPKKRKLRVLDIGTGAGKFLEALSEILTRDGTFESELFGIDHKLKEDDQARLKNQGILAERVEIETALKSNPFGKPFDLVVANAPVQSFSGSELDSLMTALVSPGGMFIVRFWSADPALEASRKLLLNSLSALDYPHRIFDEPLGNFPPGSEWFSALEPPILIKGTNDHFNFRPIGTSQAPARAEVRGRWERKSKTAALRKTLKGLPPTEDVVFFLRHFLAAAQQLGLKHFGDGEFERIVKKAAKRISFTAAKRRFQLLGQEIRRRTDELHQIASEGRLPKTPYYLSFREALRKFEEGHLYWKRTTYQMRREFLKLLAVSAGVSVPGLTLHHFLHQKISLSGGKSISLTGLLSFYRERKTRGRSFIETIRLLKQETGYSHKEKLLPYASFAEAKRAFLRGHISWRKTDRSMRRQFVEELARANGKAAGALTTKDFKDRSKTPFLTRKGDKKGLAGLPEFYRRYDQGRTTGRNIPKSMVSGLRLLKKDLGLEDLTPRRRRPRPWQAIDYDPKIVDENVKERVTPVQGSDLSSKGPLAGYRRDVEKYRKLSRRELVFLSQEIRKGNGAARQALIEHGLRFAIKPVLDFHLRGGKSLSLDDLFSEAREIITKKVHRFKPHRANFSTFVYRIVYWGLIDEYLRKQAKLRHGRETVPTPGEDESPTEALDRFSPPSPADREGSGETPPGEGTLDEALQILKTLEREKAVTPRDAFVFRMLLSGKRQWVIAREVKKTFGELISPSRVSQIKGSVKQGMKNLVKQKLSKASDTRSEVREAEVLVAEKFLGGILPWETHERLMRFGKAALRREIGKILRKMGEAALAMANQKPAVASAPARRFQPLRPRKQPAFFKAPLPQAQTEDERLPFSDPSAELQLLRSA